MINFFLKRKNFLIYLFVLLIFDKCYCCMKGKIFLYGLFVCKGFVVVEVRLKFIVKFFKGFLFCLIYGFWGSLWVGRNCGLV